MFWLSHHHQAEWHRCYRVGNVRLCARCLGTYPLLWVALAVQFGWGVPLSHPADWLSVALVVPATVDWAVGRFRPHAGSNGWRTVTGLLLGLGLARSLFIHFQRPFPPVLVAQLALVTGVALPVIFVAYRRSRGG